MRIDSVLLQGMRLCIPQNKVLKDSIIEEAHSSAYSIHPRSIKMYRTLKAYLLLWLSMFGEVVEFVAKCLNCQQVKPQRQNTGRLLSPLPILE